MHPTTTQKLGALTRTLHYSVSNISITAQTALMVNTSDLLVMGPFKAVHSAQSENYLIVGNTKAKTSNGKRSHKIKHIIQKKRAQYKIRTRESKNFLMFLSYISFTCDSFPLSGLCEEVPKVPPDPSVCGQWDHQREPKRGRVHAGDWEALCDRHRCPAAS